MSKKNILYKKTATKEQLRQALAEATGQEYAPFVSLSGDDQLAVGIRELFEREYEKEYNKPYLWQVKDNNAIRQLIGKCDALATYQYQRQATAEDVIVSMQAVLNRLPTWYRQKGFTPALINSKFNEITAEIKLEASKESQNVVASAMKMMFGDG